MLMRLVCVAIGQSLGAECAVTTSGCISQGSLGCVALTKVCYVYILQASDVLHHLTNGITAFHLRPRLAGLCSSEMLYRSTGNAISQ